MLKKLIGKEKSAPQLQKKNRITPEAAELNEIGERLFRKLEAGVRGLEAIEKRIDAKSEKLELLIKRAEAAAASPVSSPSDLRSREIMAMLERGLSKDEIAKVLCLPKGEVELIISLMK